MTLAGRIPHGKHTVPFLVLLMGAGLLARWFVLNHWMDIPGDGPTRAMYAYNWFKSPYLQMYGIWLPGFMYLTGGFSYILPDPLISIRIFNLILGMLTLAFFYLLICRIYGPVSGISSAFMLAFLPLHVGLSVSSLTEATFLFELIGAMLFLILAARKRPRRVSYLFFFLVFACLALMTRYESWTLIPLFVLYLYWSTRNGRQTILILLILALFPAIWSVANYIYTGDLLFGFTGAKDMTWAKPTGLLGAGKILARILVEQFGWAPLILAIWGAVTYVVYVIKGKAEKEGILYIAVALAYWIVMLRFAMVRGETFQARYLLFGLVMIIPFVALPILSLSGANNRFLNVALIFTLTVFLVPHMAHYPHGIQDLTRENPQSIKEIAQWLKKSTDPRTPVLMTRLRAQATYVPLYFPEIGRHDHGHFIYYHHIGMSEERLKRFLTNRRPGLLITCDKDRELVCEIEKVWDRTVLTREPVYESGEIKVYKTAPRLEKGRENRFLEKSVEGAAG